MSPSLAVVVEPGFAPFFEAGEVFSKIYEPTDIPYLCLVTRHSPADVDDVVSALLDWSRSHARRVFPLCERDALIPVWLYRPGNALYDYATAHAMLFCLSPDVCWAFGDGPVSADARKRAGFAGVCCHAVNEAGDIWTM